MKFFNPLKLIDKKHVRFVIRIASIVTLVSVALIILIVALQNRQNAIAFREHQDKVNRILFRGGR